jgi:hypothetical protein
MLCRICCEGVRMGAGEVEDFHQHQPQVVARILERRLVARDRPLLTASR